MSLDERCAQARSKRGKVVHLTSVHEPFDTRIFLKECKSLARAGYEVTLIVPHKQDEVADGVVIKSVPRASGRVSRMTRTVWRLYREALRQDADIYHFHDPELIPVGLLLRARGKKVVYDVHEDVLKDILTKPYLAKWVRRPLGWIIKHIEVNGGKQFSALAIATPAIAERFAPAAGMVTLIQNFALLEEFPVGDGSSWDQRPPAVAYVGGITRIRGIRQMVEAMGLLPEGLGTKLILAGEFWPLSLPRELAALPGWSRIEMLGYISRAAIAELFGNVRAGLVLFLPDVTAVRSQPNKLFEYMSAGIPLIASDFPLWREIIEKAGCGLLVDPLNPKAIARAIEYVMSHPEEAQAMGMRGRKAVEDQYNWAKEERKLLDLYGTLIGGPGCAG